MSILFQFMNGEPLVPGVTLRDIAKSLGISHVTVSLALRDAPQVSVSRRKQIHEVAEKMGYRPNPMATALGQLRSSSKAQPVTAELAWINHWERPQDFHLYKELVLYWQAAHRTASWHGYNLEEFICDRNFTLSRLEKVLAARNIHGILIPPHSHLPAGWDDFPWNKFSVIRFGHSIVRPRVHVVTSDQTTNSLVAVENIRALGYRRIGFVTSKVGNTHFKGGFLMAQLNLDFKEQLPLLILATGENNSNDQKQLNQWIKKNKPDAILTNIRAMAEMLKIGGHKVPEEIGLATLSIHDGNVDSGIDQHSEEIGKAAVEMLVSLINHNYIGVPKICRELLIEGEWVNGTSMPTRLKALS